MSSRPSARKSGEAVSRRHFLFCSGLFAGSVLVGLPGLKAGPPGGNRLPPVEAYCLSLRSRRGSNAGRRHNHYHIFADPKSADSHRAHPGDNSRIVPITISRDMFQRLFISRGTAIADLRNLERIEEAPLPPNGPISQARFRRGDADGDSEITINDPLRVLNHLFTGQRAPGCPDAADADDDGELTINDATRSLNWQFLGRAAPPAPGPRTCGRDLTPSRRLGPCQYDPRDCD